MSVMMMLASADSRVHVERWMGAVFDQCRVAWNNSVVLSAGSLPVRTVRTAPASPLRILRAQRDRAVCPAVRAGDGRLLSAVGRRRESLARNIRCTCAHSVSATARWNRSTHLPTRANHRYADLPQLNWHLFREAWTRRSATSDMWRLRKALT